jgi:SAM-dependent methyltransferase
VIFLSTMSLPDVSRFAGLPPDRWHALGARLRELGAEAAYEVISSVGGQVFPPMGLPLRRWHLRRMGGPLGDVLRLLAVDEAIPEEAARAALGAELFADLVGVGLLERLGPDQPPDHVRATLKLWMFEGVLFFADELGHGGDAVMGPAQLTSALVRLAIHDGGDPGAPGPVGQPARAAAASALELGCGAAVAAVYLARHFERVVATDINPRALVLARVNAALNGAGNVEVRQGDLYAPVAGERFDLILCQPPFIPRPDGAAEATYMYGGTRGDELPLRMIAGISAHLAPRGRGLVVMEWPVFAGEAPLEDRVRAVVPADADVLVLDAAGPDLDSYAAGDTAYEHPELGPEFARKAVQRREHLDRLGVESIRAAIAVIAPAGRAPGWTMAIPIDDLTVDAAQLDGLVAAAELLAGQPEALLAARLRAGTGVAFAMGKESVRVVFPPGAPRRQLLLNPGAYRIVTLVDGAPTVQIALNRFRKEGNYKPQQALERFLPALHQMLATGVVEVVR